MFTWCTCPHGQTATSGLVWRLSDDHERLTDDHDRNPAGRKRTRDHLDTSHNGQGCAMKRVAMFLVWTLVAVVAGFMLLGIIAAIVGGLSGI